MSPAKMAKNDVIFLMSNVYVKKIRGPSTDPWGTPLRTSIDLLTASPIFTLKVRSLRNESIHRCKLPRSPRWSNLCKSRPFGIVFFPVGHTAQEVWIWKGFLDFYCPLCMLFVSKFSFPNNTRKVIWKLSIGFVAGFGTCFFEGAPQQSFFTY